MSLMLCLPCVNKSVVLSKASILKKKTVLQQNNAISNFFRWMIPPKKDGGFLGKAGNKGGRKGSGEPFLT